MFPELTRYPLPLRLSPADQAPQRRHYAGPVDLRSPAFTIFAHVAEEVTQATFNVSPDQISSVARWVQQQYASRQAAPCVSARMHVMAALRALRAEPGWELPPEPAQRSGQLLAYQDAVEHLIPVRLPLLGHLDEAILLELALPGIADDLREYLDYRRLRRIEAELSGVAPHQLTFTRDDWMAVREAEHRLLAHFRRGTPGHYTRGLGDAPRFRVH